MRTGWKPDGVNGENQKTPFSNKTALRGFFLHDVVKICYQLSISYNKEKAKWMLQGVFDKVRLGLKQFSMSQEWNAGMSGDFDKVSRWKKISEFFRNDQDAVDIVDDQLDTVVRNLARFPHDMNDKAAFAQAIEKAIKESAISVDCLGQDVTVKRIADYMDNLDDEKKAEIMPVFSAERMQEHDTFKAEQEEIEARRNKYMEAYEAEQKGVPVLET